MGIQQVNWEDEENNRIVNLEVRYTVNGSEVQVDEVAPTKVEFVDATSKEVVRAVKVWTEAGRKLLRRQYLNTTSIEDLQTRIAGELLATA